MLTRLTASLLLLPALAGAQAVRVVDDPRAEVVGILFRIAGAPDFGNGTVQPYIRQVDSAFIAFKDHAVFRDINVLRAKGGLSLSAVMSMAPQITDPVSFRERSPIDAPSSTLAAAWRGAEARPILADARDFARVANVARFLRDHQPAYDSATVRMQRLVAAQTRLEWFTTFFGEPAGGVFIISPMLINSTGNFAAEFQDGPTHERYAYLGVSVADSAGYPVITPDVIPTLVHELNHTFVNHVVAARWSELQTAGTAMFAKLADEMHASGYYEPLVMLQESIVRASVIRYLRATQGQRAADDETAIQRGLGFFWMNRLVALLGQYEADRQRYPTLQAFAPRIATFYDELAPQVDSLRAAFERRRPRVISASIADGARDVDPHGAVLVLRFDQPVSSAVQMVRSSCCGIPEFTAATFDSNRTTLTLAMKLEPDRDYILPLGPGFRTDDDVPNQRFTLRFHTRSTP